MTAKRQRPPGQAAGADTARDYLRAFDALHASPVPESSQVHRLLDRLDGVRQIGDQKWIARCPAHDDKTPSLHVAQTEAGVVLVHDFSGCSAADIVAAVGLEQRDLFPPRDPSERRAAAKAASTRDAARVLAREALIVAVAADNLAAGRELSADDHARLREAAAMLRRAAGAAT